MSEALATTAQHMEDAPVTTTAPGLEGSWALVSLHSPAHQSGTPPLPMHPMLDIPFVGTPLVGHQLAGFMVGPTHTKQGSSPNSTPDNQCKKRTNVDSLEVEVRSEHSSMKGDQNSPGMAQKAGPSCDP